MMLEADWIHLGEIMDGEGQLSLAITHSEGITPWKILGMLQAAGDFHRTMTTNIFFGSPTGFVGEWVDEDFEDDE